MALHGYNAYFIYTSFRIRFVLFLKMCLRVLVKFTNEKQQSVNQTRDEKNRRRNYLVNDEKVVFGDDKI